jgi:apolipoprotein N-acyltransferase
VGLKSSWIGSPATRRCGTAALGGILLSMAFAPAEIAGAAWVAPGLILFCALGANGAEAFWIGFVAGLTHFLSSLYWLLAMPFDWHGIPLAPGLAWFSLSAYCALFFALWVWFCWRIFPGDLGTGAASSPRLRPPGEEREKRSAATRATRPEHENGLAGTATGPGLSILAVLDNFLSTPVWKRAGWAILCACGWTALEYARGLFLSGFPWNFLGVSQYRLLPVIQVASLTGVYGVTFLVVWFSVAIGSTMLVLARKPTAKHIWGDAALPLLALAGVVSFGMSQCLSAPPPARRLKLALVQPSIPQTLIFDPAADEKRFGDVIALSEQALESTPDVLVWPESAVPALTEDNQRTIGKLLESHPVWLLFCADSSDVLPSGATAIYNSSFLVNPKGAVGGIYHKRRLVIFGEYIPLVRWLPFLRWLTPIGDGFTPGDRVAPFNLTGLGASVSTLICFEDTFPQEARLHTAPETDFLVNLTNDGWFGDGPEQKQHAVMALFRAVENGVPLVRCTNNGLTCWIDAQGRIREKQETGGSIYGPGFIAPEIPLRDPHRGQTFYNLHGDWFSWGCWGMSLLALVFWKGNLSTGPREVSNS